MTSTNILRFAIIAVLCSQHSLVNPLEIVYSISPRSFSLSLLSATHRTTVVCMVYLEWRHQRSVTKDQGIAVSSLRFLSAILFVAKTEKVGCIFAVASCTFKAIDRKAYDVMQVYLHRLTPCFAFLAFSAVISQIFAASSVAIIYNSSATQQRLSRLKMTEWLWVLFSAACQHI